MPAVPVPDLKQKFALLRTYPLPRTWPQLAAEFDRNYKTLQTWQDGKENLQDPNRVPDWALPILTRLVGAALPGARSADQVRDFVSGPAAMLEEELRTGLGSSMMLLVTREAQAATVSLIRRPDGIELVEVEQAATAPHPRLRLGEWFRIAVRRRRQDGYLVALQHTQAVWAVVPTGVAAQEPQLACIPGLDADGNPAFMRERRDPGRHLFVCLETPDPPPAQVKAHGRDETILDKRALDALATFFEAQPADRRACHLLDVEIEAGAA